MSNSAAGPRIALDRSKLLGFDQIPGRADGMQSTPDTRLTKVGQKIDHLTDSCSERQQYQGSKGRSSR